MWREYNEAQGVTHNIQMQLMRNGGGTGWTRGLVNSFLMEADIPIRYNALKQKVSGAVLDAPSRA